MTLKELKEPFEENIKNYKNKLDNYSYNDIAELLVSSSSLCETDINAYTSYLICAAWNLVQRIYYVNNNAKLSCEECYDIFIQAFYYVLENHVWTNPTSSLYNDSDAFMKAMAVTIQSRKKNFIEAKFKQKRVINNNAISLDGIYEDFPEGYFSFEYNEPDYSVTDYIIEDKIAYYFNNDCYLTAFILEGILYNNIFDADNNLDLRKLRKYLKNIDDEFCLYFSYKYNLPVQSVQTSIDMINSYSHSMLDKKIHTSFITLKNDDTIKQILDI